MRVTGWECRVCGAGVDIAAPFPWRCPNSTAFDRRHVLAIVDRDPELSAGHEIATAQRTVDENPFVAHDEDLAWAAFANANGIDATTRRAIVTELDDAVRAVAGVGFVATPFGRSDALSEAFGFADGGGVWVKDETGGVGGSQKARHLFTILLHLIAAERLGYLPHRPPLAIASCGNAALAAATLAAQADWPLDVYVPTWMDDAFGERLDEFGAHVHRCARRDGDPPGDPAMLRFREARSAGAIPFTVQGPENGLCLDGGRTIGWEIADQAEAAGVVLDRVVVQVGGGAFAACMGAGLGQDVRLDTVQTEGCAPLAEAWKRIASVEQPERYWSQVMRPWPDPQSVADGILDDETYDWIADVKAMRASGGRPLVATEAEILRAHELAVASGFRVSATGSAGLAGLLHVSDELVPTDRVAVIMSGLARS